jgi:ABC-type transport system involved in multi-copper enzyme maturation permease subunit
MMILFAVSVIGVNFIVSEIVEKLAKTEIPSSAIWEFVPYVSSFLLVIPGLIMIMHTCSEYTFRTHRQNVIDGLSRRQYITTKILFIVVLALFSTAVTIIASFMMRLLSNGGISFENFRYIGYFFVQAMAYISFAFLFALLLKRTGLAIGLFFVYSLIVENILERNVNKISAGVTKIGEFLPLASSEHLLMPRDMQEVLNMAKMGNAHSEYAYLVASIIYIVLLFVACYYRYEKQDL